MNKLWPTNLSVSGASTDLYTQSDTVGLAGRQSSSNDRAGKVPGEPGVWLLVFPDLAFFAWFFGLWVFYRTRHPEIFPETQATFDVTFGGINTLLLIVSSWCVATALHLSRKREMQQARTMIIGAMTCGAGFSLIKVLEYYSKAAAGIHIDTNVFYTLYFLGTGMHFLHVLFGMGLLLLMWMRLSKARLNHDDTTLLENGATYWHMVDLLWIVLFPLIYLMG